MKNQRYSFSAIWISFQTFKERRWKRWKTSDFINNDFHLCILTMWNVSAADPVNETTVDTPKIMILNVISQSSYYHQTFKKEKNSMNHWMSVYAGTTTTDPTIPDEEDTLQNINLQKLWCGFCMWLRLGAQA